MPQEDRDPRLCPSPCPCHHRDGAGGSSSPRRMLHGPGSIARSQPLQEKPGNKPTVPVTPPAHLRGTDPAATWPGTD